MSSWRHICISELWTATLSMLKQAMHASRLHMGLTVQCTGTPLDIHHLCLQATLRSLMVATMLCVSVLCST